MTPTLMITLAVIGGLVALLWPSAAKQAPQPFTLGVHPAAKQLPEVEAFAALHEVKQFLLDKGVAEEEVNQAIAPLLIHFTSRG